MNTKIYNLERNISNNEKLFHLLQNKFETFSIQFILEGTGDIDEYEFERAVEKSFKYTSLINVKLKGRKWISCGLPKIINLKEIELNLNYDIFRKKHNIKNDGTCMIYLFKNAIVFNVFHGVVDGKGIQIWIENIFKILSNKIPIEETSFENDDEFLKRFSTFYNAKNIKPDVTIPKDNSNKKSRFFRIELPYKNKDIIYLIGKATTDSLSSGKQRFMIPTDTRKYNKESIITSNLVRPILLNINEGDNINSIREYFLNSLRNKEELSRFSEKMLSIITKNSLIGSSAINLVTLLQNISNVNLGTGTISNLGEVDLKNYSYKDFETKKIYSIPIVQPYAPISVSIIENNFNTQIVLGIYKGYLTEEIIKNIIFKIKKEVIKKSKNISEPDNLLYFNNDKDVDTLFVFNKLKEILNINHVSLDSNFFELGGDSFDYVSLQLEIIKKYQLGIIEEKKLIELMGKNYNNLTTKNIINSLKKVINKARKI